MSLFKGVLGLMEIYRDHTCTPSVQTLQYHRRQVAMSAGFWVLVYL